MSPAKTTGVTQIKSQKCRCCTNPSSKFLELDSANKNCGTVKTYKDVLYEIMNIKVSLKQEKCLTQKLCQKCSTQLNNCYKFIAQAREVYEQYLQTLDELGELVDEEEIKDDFENIPEPLIEVPIDLINVEKSTDLITKESPLATESSPLAADEIKTEPLALECVAKAEEFMNIDNLGKDKDIKEEKPEYIDYNNSNNANNDKKDKRNDLTLEQFTPELTIDAAIHEEEREHFDTFNSDSEDDEDAEDPISEDDFDKDLSKAPIAISCDICHKIYKDRVALRTHKHYTHMPDEKKRPCPLCSFKSSRLSNLKVHIGVVHGADKVKEIFKPADDNGVQFPCSICQQTFRRKDTLQKHIKRIHQNPQPKEPRIKAKVPKEKERFLCTYCGGSFRTKYGLSRHVVIHTGERPFPCEICQKTFKRPEDLHMHRIIHSDAKPHQCLQCGKAFKRSDKLKIHMRVHSELRPYKCNECEKTFKYPNVLSTHMLIHTGQNPFQCKTCGESFSLRSSFNTHCLRNGHL
ncbi:zinc finger protein 724-like [Lucilia cuprina]|uniref:zinc finger protein 724-like n=1 Tax=Lucilia cuprina TaxID=7375 RepID=UPI001F0656B0|nr:zinc finger protein 724-like [Lucilia cuprina]